MFGRVDNKYFFGLPGNPVSTIVAFRMFVAPVLQSLLKSSSGPQLLRARLDVVERRDSGRTAIVPALLRFEGESYWIRTAPWKGSSDLAGLSRANALVVIPQGEGSLQPGDAVDFLSLE